MRISDWSSDVCSSDLIFREHAEQGNGNETLAQRPGKSNGRLRGTRLRLGPVLDDFGLGDRRQDRRRGWIIRRGRTVCRYRRPLRSDSLRRTVLHLQTLRSEEHTSELQSLMRISYAVFCLKKKKKTTHTT